MPLVNRQNNIDTFKVTSDSTCKQFVEQICRNHGVKCIIISKTYRHYVYSDIFDIIHVVKVSIFKTDIAKCIYLSIFY
jgi:hypothetical protein